MTNKHQHPLTICYLKFLRVLKIVSRLFGIFLFMGCKSASWAVKITSWAVRIHIMGCKNVSWAVKMHHEWEKCIMGCKNGHHGL